MPPSDFTASMIGKEQDALLASMKPFFRLSFRNFLTNASFSFGMALNAAWP